VPQVAIEYSANLAGALDVRALGLRIHDLLVAHAGAGLLNCKTRLVRIEDSLIGDGAPSAAMIHADLRILPGRSAAQKRALGEEVLAALGDAAPDWDGTLQLTAEVRELDGDNYHKRLIGG
jgi:5-carboxymethyl-2-hydroxymuconate isomerase